MLGFNSAQIGGTTRTADAADIVASTPSGNLMIIECTTGLLKSDKISRLIERTELAKKRLHSSGNTFQKVLPVIVTSKPKNEIQADLREVQSKGVAVVTKENLEATLALTMAMQNPETIFNQLLESVQPKQNFMGY